MNLEKINDRITYSRLKLVLPEGQCVEVSLFEARQYSEQYSLDMIEVSPPKNGLLAVCKLADIGKMKYMENKKKHNNQSNKTVLKEIWVNYNTDLHDIQIKNNKVKEFLEKKYRVLYGMELRGRERTLTKEAEERFNIYLKDFVDISSWEKVNVSKSEKKISITVTLSPKA